ncbi:ankyrin repeat family protein [Desarmillaria ectypa]|nr:ankyrin repeat family protein [Desarmillaria ectypa]
MASTFKGNLATHPSLSQKLMKLIRIKVAHPNHGSVGSLYALHIFRSRCSNRFLEAMDMEGEEMNVFGMTLFDKFGRIKPHIVTEGYLSGTGCWGEELSEGQIVYITHIDVTEKYQRQGTGSLLLDKLFDSDHVQDKDFFLLQGKIFMLTWLRVGKTEFFGYSPLPHHPSRLVQPEGNMTPGIADTIQSFFNNDPLSISRPDPDGLRPIFIAAASENIHAVRKLLDLGVRHDLFDCENGDGLTPLEMLQGGMRSLWEFSETLLPCWNGYPESGLRIEYLLKNAMNILVDGLSDDEYVYRKKYGCTCGHCGVGWLSPRMRFQLSCQAGFFRDMMPMNLEYFTPRQVIDIRTLSLDVASDYLPLQLHSSLYKTFYTDYISIFGVPYDLLGNSDNSFSLDIVDQSLGTTFLRLFTFNGSWLGDGEFHAIFDDDKDYKALLKCANDLKFQLVRDMLGLTADRPWGPYSSRRNYDPFEIYVDSEDSEEDEDGMLF